MRVSKYVHTYLRTLLADVVVHRRTRHLLFGSGVVSVAKGACDVIPSNRWSGFVLGEMNGFFKQSFSY